MHCFFFNNFIYFNWFEEYFVLLMSFAQNLLYSSWEIFDENDRRLADPGSVSTLFGTVAFIQFKNLL